MCAGCSARRTGFIVDAAGGTFYAAGGRVSFFFPAGAVPEATTITVTPETPPQFFAD